MQTCNFKNFLAGVKYYVSIWNPFVISLIVLPLIGLIFGELVGDDYHLIKVSHHATSLISWYGYSMANAGVLSAVLLLVGLAWITFLNICDKGAELHLASRKIQPSIKTASPNLKG